MHNIVIQPVYEGYRIAVNKPNGETILDTVGTYRTSQAAYDRVMHLVNQFMTAGIRIHQKSTGMWITIKRDIGVN